MINRKMTIKRARFVARKIKAFTNQYFQNAKKLTIAEYVDMIRKNRIGIANEFHTIACSKANIRSECGQDAIDIHVWLMNPEYIDYEIDNCNMLDGYMREEINA